MLFSAGAAKHPGNSAELRRAADRAEKSGVDSEFLARIMSSKDADFIKKTVRINVTNYAYTPDYSGHYNKNSVKKVKAFLKKQDSLLRAVEKKHGVSRHIVASILWIESRCGAITGKYNVPSVYLSLVLADDPKYVKQSYDKVISDNKFNKRQRDSVHRLIEKRAARKSKWAIKELKSLQKIDARGIIDVTALNGSWAGAFGYPQFLPSSYNRLAIDGNGDGLIDLYNFADASHSIGNYLKKNGWSKKSSKQRKAVRAYNNSDAYVDAVFTLARKVASSK